MIFFRYSLVSFLRNCNKKSNANVIDGLKNALGNNFRLLHYFLSVEFLKPKHLFKTRPLLENREEIKRKKGKSFVPEPLMVSISTRATLAPFAALQMVQAASVASVRTRHQVGLEFESGHRITVGFIFIIIAHLICTLVSDLKGTA